MGRAQEQEQGELVELAEISRLPTGRERERRVNNFVARRERLVRYIARQWEGAGDKDDVEQAVRWGLWDAVRRWDPDRAKSFGGWAVTQVRARIKTLRLAQPLVRIPESDLKTLRLLRKVHPDLGTASIAELVRLSGLSETNVRIALEQAARPRGAVALEDSDQANGDHEAVLVGLLDAMRTPREVEEPAPPRRHHPRKIRG